MRAPAFKRNQVPSREQVVCPDLESSLRVVVGGLAGKSVLKTNHEVCM